MAVFIFAAVYFSLIACNREAEVIPLENNICLFRGEGDLNGYSLVLMQDEHFFRTLVEPNPVEIHYTSSSFLVAQNNDGLIYYYKIMLDQVKTPKVIGLKKDFFDKEVKNCASCKEIRLALDTTKHMWVVKK